MLRKLMRPVLITPYMATSLFLERVIRSKQKNKKWINFGKSDWAPVQAQTSHLRNPPF